MLRKRTQCPLQGLLGGFVATRSTKYVVGTCARPAVNHRLAVSPRERSGRVGGNERQARRQGLLGGRVANRGTRPPPLMECGQLLRALALSALLRSSRAARRKL